MVISQHSIMSNFSSHVRDVPEEILSQMDKTDKRIKSYPKRSSIKNAKHEEMLLYLKKLRQLSSIYNPRYNQ